MHRALHARFRLPEPDLTTAAGFVAAVTEAAGTGGHLQHLRMTSGGVDIALCTTQSGLWLTEADLELARRISTIAREQGLAPEPSAVTQLEIALDMAQEDVVGPFWSALLTGSPGNKIQDSIFDPTGRVPSLWFQSTDEHQTPRQRWHFDLWLAPEAAQERIGRRRGRRFGAVRRPGPGVHSAGRPRRQPGLRVHLAGPRLMSALDLKVG